MYAALPMHVLNCLGHVEEDPAVVVN
jgi:hypothetical protein